MPFGEQQVGSEALDELKDLDVANMTPLEAISALFRLQEQANKASE
jgi:hypothetical protein